MIEGIRPLQERFCDVQKEPGYIDSMLRDGADKVRPLAERTLATVKEKVGLG